jgi:hypothetical protein
MHVLLIARCIACAFFAVLFLQSGIDKITDRKGNLEWLVPHFSSSPFRNTVPAMLTVLTAFELASGVLCAVSILALLMNHWPILPGFALTFVCLTFTMLFTGQRLAKDYVGAASLAGYFASALVALLLVGAKK